MAISEKSRFLPDFIPVKGKLKAATDLARRQTHRRPRTATVKANLGFALRLRRALQTKKGQGSPGLL